MKEKEIGGGKKIVQIYFLHMKMGEKKKTQKKHERYKQIFSPYENECRKYENKNKKCIYRISFPW